MARKGIHRSPQTDEWRLMFPSARVTARLYLFGFIKVSSQTPVEKRRVIRVMRSEKVARKLSAEDIAKLPADSEG